MNPWSSIVRTRIVIALLAVAVIGVLVLLVQTRERSAEQVRPGPVALLHMCSIMFAPNSEHLISVAPSISRAKS